MFTLELLNQPAQEIIEYWKDTGTDLRWFDIKVNNEVTIITCKHARDYFTDSELNWITKPVIFFQEFNLSPYSLKWPTYDKHRYYFADGGYGVFQCSGEPFNWTEQLERYKYSLMLKATG